MKQKNRKRQQYRVSEELSSVETILHIYLLCMLFFVSEELSSVETGTYQRFT